MTRAEAAAKTTDRAMTNAVEAFVSEDTDVAEYSCGDSLSGIIVTVEIRQVPVGSS